MLRLFSSRSSRADMPTTTIGVSPAADRWVRQLLRQRLQAEARGRQIGRTGDGELDGLLDVRLAGPGEPKGSEGAFDRLRWGGVFACVDPNADRVARLMQEYNGRNGFLIQQPVDELWGGTMGLRIPGITPRAHYFVARKVHLAQPGKVSDRFTYDVTLQPDPAQPEGFRVCKQIPTVQDTVYRLLRREPGIDPTEAQVKARKLIEQVFPIFLTREAKMLELVQANMPPAYRDRVPKLLDVAKNKQGFVTRIDMNWLRNGGRPITQLEFARQATEMLTVLHDHARMMHLDLRADNMVITPRGVGFIDFGTAAHLDEDLQNNAVLGPLFKQVMQTSQIQKTLGEMLRQGGVTNSALAGIYGKPDKKVDTFQLALILNQPHSNPEFERLVLCDPLNESARQLEALTAALLRPSSEAGADYKTAADLLRGVRRIEQRAAA